LNPARKRWARPRRAFRPRLESLEDRITPSTVQLTNQNFVDGPKYLTPVGSTLYFVANDGTHGEQLWRTDGRPRGAVPVQSGLQPVDPGAYPNSLQQVAQIGPWLYFFSDNTDGTYTLWRNNSSVNPTGGTSPSQALLSLDADPAAQSGSPLPFGPWGLTAIGHDLYFGNYSAAFGGYQLWKTTGADGANPVTAPFLYPGADATGPGAIKAAGSNLYFEADVVQNGATNFVLWGSDGTTAGTAPIQDGSGGYVPAHNASLFQDLTDFAAVGNDLYYINGTVDNGGVLWRISGPGATAEQISSSVGNPNSVAYQMQSYQMTAVGDTLYFVTDVNGGPPEYIIWKCQGSTLSEVWQSTTAGDYTFGTSLVQIVGLGSNAYFTDTTNIPNPNYALPYEPHLWKTDGTPGVPNWSSRLTVTSHSAISVLGRSPWLGRTFTSKV
jgi:ELWxxDGT repeat protein